MAKTSNQSLNYINKECLNLLAPLLEVYRENSNNFIKIFLLKNICSVLYSFGKEFMFELL